MYPNRQRKIERETERKKERESDRDRDRERIWLLFMSLINISPR